MLVRLHPDFLKELEEAQEKEMPTEVRELIKTPEGLGELIMGISRHFKDASPEDAKQAFAMAMTALLSHWAHTGQLELAAGMARILRISVMRDQLLDCIPGEDLH